MAREGDGELDFQGALAQLVAVHTKEVQLARGQSARGVALQLDSESSSDLHESRQAVTSLSEGAQAPDWLELWSIWSERPAGDAVERPAVRERATVFATYVRYFQTRSTRSVVQRKSLFFSGDKVESGSTCFKKIVMAPNATRRIIWDVLSMILLCYDLLMVPLQAVFFTGDSRLNLLNVLSMGTTVFWTVDIVFSLSTGFYRDGLIEMRFLMIFARYARGWFAFDMFLCTSDWAVIILNHTEFYNVVRGTKSLRLARALRVLRLLRLLKIAKMANEMKSVVRRESQVVIWGIVRLFIVVVVLNHYIACVWYYIGSEADPSAGYTWLTKIENSDTRSNFYKYVSSLHWSLTQFTPASMEITPTNSWERLFTILVIIFALLVFSSVVSSITNAMNNLQRINQEQRGRDEDLRRYITENRVSFRVGSLIYQYCRHAHNEETKRLHEHDVCALKRLPNILRMQLRADVFGPHLLQHPLLLKLKPYGDWFVEVCHQAMSEDSLSKGNQMFAVGERCAKMFFVTSGTLDYYYQATNTEELVSSGTQLCEAALWVQWTHRGRLVARVLSELMILDTIVFRERISQDPQLLECARDYARRYSERAKHLHAAQRVVSDLPVVEDNDVEATWDMVQEACELYHPSDEPKFGAVLSSPKVMKLISLNSGWRAK